MPAHPLTYDQTATGLTTAVIEASDRLRLYRAELARVLGNLCGDVGDLVECRRELVQRTDEWSAATMFVELYNRLDQYFDGDLVQMRHWLRAENRILGNTPLLAIVDQGRLGDVLRQLDDRAETMEFSRAGMSDIPRLLALVQSAYRGEASRKGWTTEADLLGGTRTDEVELRELIARPDSRFVLCRINGELIASVHIERQGEQGYLGMFAVSPDQQGRGIGKALLAEAERIAREEWACREMIMTVIVQRQDVIDWYYRRGYRRTGEHRPFPYGIERYGKPRRNDLRLEVLQKVL